MMNSGLLDILRMLLVIDRRIPTYLYPCIAIWLLAEEVGTALRTIGMGRGL